MPNIASIIRDQVTLSTRCVDRLYVNGYLPKLQAPKQLRWFLGTHLGQPVVSPALFRGLRERFVEAVRSFVREGAIPVVRFERGQRKDDVAAQHRRRFEGAEGVVFVGVAQERASSFRGQKHVGPTARVDFTFQRHNVYVNHFYFYFEDLEWGPGFLKVGSYLPYPVKLCLNGHEWAKQQLRREGIGFESLDNGFFTCAAPQRLQAICDRLGAEDVQACFDRWSRRLPWPLSAEDRAAGYEHRLSIWQLETSLTQVFARPVHGRQFFEEVLREHLDLGRPDRIALLFPRRLTKRTPPPPHGYRTRILTRDVTPTLRVDYKRSHVKQYLKQGRALRTETTINNPYDFKVNKGLENLAYLRRLGDTINRRLLEVEVLSHHCPLSETAFERLQRPTLEDGHRTPALRFGDRRVMALLQALCHLAHVPAGFRNRTLRPEVAALLGDPHYGPGQMTYDLRRLRRKGLIARIAGTHRYIVTTYGLKVALFVSKLYLRVLRPAWNHTQAAVRSVPYRLHRALQRVQTEIDRLVHNAQLQNLTQTPRSGAM